MNIGEIVKAAHQGIAGNRCFPNTFPQPPAAPVWPAIRYTVISRDADVTIDGTDEGETDDIRVQVDYVATGYVEARDVRDLGVGAMLSQQTVPCVRAGEFETYDTETKVHRFVVTFVFYPSSSTGSPA